MLIAKRYKFLRNVLASAKTHLPVNDEPIRIAILLTSEVSFKADPAMVHHQTVFLEDRMHDWSWSSGILRYYGSGREEPVTLVLVYEEEEQVAVHDSRITDSSTWKFDPQTGQPLKTKTKG